MKHSIHKWLFIFCLVGFVPATVAAQSTEASVEVFSDAQLEELLAPIAIYPDPLLAQILPASTYPIEIVEASRLIQDEKDFSKIDSQNWDPSVKAVAHYPTVLKMMSEDLDWTQQLGQAVLNQQDDVLQTVQVLRQKAQVAGNLRTTKEQVVEVADKHITILSADPEVIYVPVYDPQVIYVVQTVPVYRPRVHFSLGWRFGSWLSIGFYWPTRTIFHCEPRYWHPHHHREYVRNVNIYNVHNTTVVNNTYVQNNRNITNNVWRHNGRHGNPHNGRRGQNYQQSYQQSGHNAQHSVQSVSSRQSSSALQPRMPSQSRVQNVQPKNGRQLQPLAGQSNQRQLTKSNRLNSKMSSGDVTKAQNDNLKKFQRGINSSPRTQLQSRGNFAKGNGGGSKSLSANAPKVRDTQSNSKRMTPTQRQQFQPRQNLDSQPKSSRNVASSMRNGSESRIQNRTESRRPSGMGSGGFKDNSRSRPSSAPSQMKRPQQRMSHGKSMVKS